MCKRILPPLSPLFLLIFLLSMGCATKRLLPSALELVVTQQPMGNPLAGAQVVAWPLEEMDVLNPAGWTDSAGHVSLVLPPTKGDFKLLIQQPEPGFVREERREFQLISNPVHSWVFPLRNEIVGQGGTLDESEQQDAKAPKLSIKVIPAAKLDGK